MSIAISDPCRAEGNRDAGTDTINKVTNDCLSGVNGLPGPTAEAESALRTASCAQNGREEGKLRASLYCLPEGVAASAELGSICDQITAIYCKNAFRAAVNADPECRQKALNDPNFTRNVDAACAPVQ